MAANYRDAIAAIESAGSGNYGAIGPPANSRGSRAYGRYQVMDFNVGPWTRAALGRELTPEEFRNDPAAQDAVFDHIFGGYVTRFGPSGAAQAWFGGPGSVDQGGTATDVLGTSGNEYVTRFNELIGVSDQGRPAAAGSRANSSPSMTNALATAEQPSAGSAGRSNALARYLQPADAGMTVGLPVVGQSWRGAPLGAGVGARIGTRR